MNEEDEEFNRIEREAKQRMEAVSAALDKKAKNARELGLDYEPAQYFDEVMYDGNSTAEALKMFQENVQPAQQEPVAYLCENAVGHKYFRWKKPSNTYKPIALYTSPPAQQEPVAWPIETNNQVEALAKQCGWDNRRYMTPADYQIWCDRMRQFVQRASPPAQRTWVGLTDEERNDLLDTYITAEGRARAIEAKLKERNQ